MFWSRCTTSQCIVVVIGDGCGRVCVLSEEHTNSCTQYVHVLESAYLFTMYCCCSTDFEAISITLIYLSLG